MAGIPTKNIDDLSAQLAQIITAISTTASTVSITDAYFNGGVVTDLDDVMDEIKAQLGGLTSTTYTFTKAHVCANNDAIYAAINKLDTFAWQLAQATSGLGASKIGVYDVAAYYTGTNLEAVLVEIKTQLGGLTSATYNFTKDKVLADNDTVYAALNKLDTAFWTLAQTTTGAGAALVGLYDSTSYWTGTELETVLLEIATQLGGATSATFDFTAGSILADDDPIYAALEKANVWAKAINVHVATTKGFVPIPLGSLMGEDGTALTTGPATVTPGFSQLANKEVVLEFVAQGTHTAVAFTVAMPLDFDGTKPVQIVWYAKMGGDTDSPNIIHECYFNVGDTDCAGTDDEIDGGQVLTAYSAEIAHGDVPDAVPAVLTCIFKPVDGQCGTDSTYFYGVGVQYARKLQTA